jgi:hypothetical protein
VIEIYQSDERKFARNVKLCKDAIKLFNMIMEEIKPFTSGSNSPYFQYESIISVNTHLEGSTLFMQDLQEKAQRKRAEIFKNYQLKLL